MNGGRRGLAAAAYLPVPGLGFLTAWLGRTDRLARFHGLQAGWLTLLVFVLLLGLGLAGAGGRVGDALALIGGGLLLTWILFALRGAVSAGRGRFAEIRFLWPLCRIAGPAAQA